MTLPDNSSLPRNCFHSITEAAKESICIADHVIERDCGTIIENINRKHIRHSETRSEVACTHTNLTLTPTAFLSSVTINVQFRAPQVSELYDNTSKWQLRTRVSNSLCTHAPTHTDASTRTDEFVFATLDPVPYAPHQHLAKFLQRRCVSKCISSILPLPSL